MAYGGFAYIYDHLMRDVDYVRWRKYVEEIFQRYDTQPCGIADVACGTGTLSILLAERGYKVIGIDSSEDMLFVAKEKARKKGLQIPFIYQDMRHIALHHPVDAILVMCDGLNYILDKDGVNKALMSMYKALKPGGMLILDISSYYKLASILGNHTMADNDHNISLIWQNSFEPDDAICQMDLTFFVHEDGCYRRLDEIHYQRAYHAEEIIEALKENRFTDIGCFHPFTFDPPKKRGHRIVFAAKK